LFWERVSCLCLGWLGPRSSCLASRVSWVDRSAPEHPVFIGRGGGGVPRTFVLAWPQTVILLMSRVAGITDMSHCTQCNSSDECHTPIPDNGAQWASSVQHERWMEVLW
jgi:hypothetical protein